MRPLIKDFKSFPLVAKQERASDILLMERAAGVVRRKVLSLQRVENHSFNQMHTNFEKKLYFEHVENNACINFLNHPLFSESSLITNVPMTASSRMLNSI